MSDTVFAALIGVGGTVIVAVASVLTQLRVTKAVIKAERERIFQQIQNEEISRLREKRVDSIREAISEMLSTSDPQSNRGVDYGRTVNLISRVQLLLNYQEPTSAKLNNAINQLGFCMQEYVAVERLPIDNKRNEMTNLLRWHAEVLESAKAAIAALSLPII
ncbi:MAG: hypothetical protein KGJ59_11095 [Bacteroidota bacterium]|nr:hypothetical protein [Bacteroidota bacterium]